jgi:predicted phage terminase large subunit-like protein
MTDPFLQIDRLIAQSTLMLAAAGNVEKVAPEDDPRESFAAFIRLVRPEYIFSWHHHLVIEALERVAKGLCRRLMIFLPFQVGKSELSSRLFPAWLMARDPDTAVMCCSYSGGSAGEFCRDVKRIMEGESYRAAFPESCLPTKADRSRVNTGDRFEIVGRKGVYRAAGVGGGIVGRNFQCFPADTIVITENGATQIESLFRLSYTGRVLSFNHQTQKPEWQRVAASRASHANELYEIRTRSGRVVRATADHRFYVRQCGYREANRLRPGDVLCALRQVPEVRNASLQDVKALPEVLLRDQGCQSECDVFLARQEWEDDEIVAVRVACSGRQSVYDIQVEGNSNFFADGILVHNCGILDDVIKNPEEANSPVYRAKLREWYNGAFHSRQRPGAAIVMLLCMTGDTPVTMSDGTHKRLDLVMPDDEVLAWKNGQMVKRKVVAARSQGEDDILEIRTGNSRVRANARHPFLVEHAGCYEWIRAGDLCKGDKIVTSGMTPGIRSGKLKLRDAWLLGYLFGDGWVTTRNTSNYDRKRDKFYPRRGYVTCVALSSDAEENARVDQALETTFGKLHWRTGRGYRRTDVAWVGKWLEESGLIGQAKTKRLPGYLFGESLAIRRAFLAGFVAADGHIVATDRPDKGRHRILLANLDLVRDLRHLARGCGYTPSNISSWRGMVQAPNSKAPIEVENHEFSWNPWSLAKDVFRLSAVRMVTPVGRAPVYDLQIEDAHCFIADGLVSHNTRWHEADLPGQLLEEAKTRPNAEQWEVISLPAIAATTDLHPQDPRQPGQAIWPERFDEQEYAARRATMSAFMWSAGYQQRPSRGEGGIVQRTYFRYFDIGQMRDERGELVPCFTFGSIRGVDQIPLAACKWFSTIDTAMKDFRKNDFTVVATWALDPQTRKLFLFHAWLCRLQIPLQWKALLALRYGPQSGHPENWLIRWDEDERCWTGERAKWPAPLMFQALEDKASGVGLIQQGVAEGKPFKVLSANGSKEQRFATVATMYENGMVYHYFGASWLEDVENQLLSFPTGAHDDVCDVTAYAGILATQDAILAGRTRLTVESYPEPNQDVVVVNGIEVSFDDPQENWWERR